jgi:UDP-glucose 4-epimerase
MATTQIILVTGGAGYIGSHTVVELITKNTEVIIVDNLSASDETLLHGIKEITGKQPLFYKIDCADKDALSSVFKNHKIDAVIHFAAFKAVGESVEQPLRYHKNNVGSLLTLLEVMEAFSVRDIIFSSSCTVYGQPDVIPVTEQSPTQKPESPYGATKQICEQILQDVAHKGFRVVSLRYFNPIGAHPTALLGELPMGRPNNLVPFITQTAAGIREQLTIFGNDYNTRDGFCVRDFIHVVDLAAAHVRALDYLKLQQDENIFVVFNIGTGEGCTVLELLTTFEKTTGVKVPYVVGSRRAGDIEKIYADTRVAFAVLQWQPVYSLAQALQHAWNWEKKIRKI